MIFIWIYREYLINLIVVSFLTLYIALILFLSPYYTHIKTMKEIWSLTGFKLNINI